MRAGHRAVCCGISLVGWCALAATAAASEFHGTVLTRGTNKPVAGVVVQAYNLGTPAGLTPRILATTKTDAHGQFRLDVTGLVKVKNVSLIVSAQGAKSELATVNGQAVVETSFQHVLATTMHPSPTDNIVLYALMPKSSTATKSKPASSSPD